MFSSTALSGFGREYNLGCQVLSVANKSSNVRKNEKGHWCDFILGALNFPNSIGDKYELSSGRDVILAGGLFDSRLKEGLAKGEYGHPKRPPGMDDTAWLNRVMYTEETKVCHKHELVFIDQIYIPKYGKKVTCFVGDFSTTGPYGDTLEQEMANPNENVTMSIRSLTEDYILGTQKWKKFIALNGWDRVTSPGFGMASKANTLASDVGRRNAALEQEIYRINKEQVNRISLSTILSAAEDRNSDMISMESAHAIKQLAHSLSKKVKISSHVPASSTW